MLSESRGQASYLPPKPAVNPGCGSANAATTALRLLECNPESLLSDARGRGGRLSAAKVARQRYEEALKAKLPGPGDLLDFGSDEPVASGGYEAPRPRLDQSAETQGSESSSDARMWPGDVVLARSSPQRACWSRARVVRMYNSRGMSLADVEWLEEDGGPSGSSGSRRDFLGASEPQRHGLQVGIEVKAIQAESPPRRPSPSTTKAVLPDLLDFSPEERPRSAPEASGGAPWTSNLLDFGGADASRDANEPQRWQHPQPPSQPPTRPMVGETTTRSEVRTPVKPEERFGFVSDLILEASDGQR